MEDQQNYIQLSSLQNNKHVSIPQTTPLSYQIQPTTFDNQIPSITYPHLPTYLIAPQPDRIAMVPIQTRDSISSDFRSNTMMAGMNQNVQIPLHQVPEITEHVIYNKNDLYKIQSNGSQLALCPNCNKYVQTTVLNKPGVGTCVTGGLLAIAGCWAGCCLVPCFINDCKNSVHYCTICNRELGKKTFLFKC